MLIVLMTSFASAKINVKYFDNYEDEIRLSVYSSDKTPGEVGVQAYAPDLGVRMKYGSFELNEKDPRRLHFLLETFETVAPGYYPMIIYLTNPEGFRQKSHTWIYVE